ncbi:hypothetical protein CIP107578_02301 [Corynebacterium diphtheriae]|uniref:Uncharacterized protein n=1 Tax=Corynebacterium diphtheriae TaxID=1717 RepID=A0A811G7H0_CORDP|nr:hypothetical protein CIP107547_00023 [Corynebacterium diphtheriae]CAB0621770.1 hypothetical protein CIP107550_02309 [Corynebacterium diphtheriae]CAB0623593.1 hypothetical protein CIP107558_02295 [Corynebacterium diphtheriae]CAB0670800.1 hypothetical protein CIP107578_02301 [Corynebacterium diphtheriae]CAB0715421.1 hypothetical protein FRC0077_02230 [Corynebacterium diphtheriae]
MGVVNQSELASIIRRLRVIGTDGQYLGRDNYRRYF